ncbi:hypothetical protein SNE40_005042 [Patella caerulea]
MLGIISDDILQVAAWRSSLHPATATGGWRHKLAWRRGWANTWRREWDKAWFPGKGGSVKKRDAVENVDDLAEFERFVSDRMAVDP